MFFISGCVHSSLSKQLSKLLYYCLCLICVCVFMFICVDEHVYIFSSLCCGRKTTSGVIAQITSTFFFLIQGLLLAWNLSNHAGRPSRHLRSSCRLFPRRVIVRAYHILGSFYVNPGYLTRNGLFAKKIIYRLNVVVCKKMSSKTPKIE